MAKNTGKSEGKRAKKLGVKKEPVRDLKASKVKDVKGGQSATPTTSIKRDIW